MEGKKRGRPRKDRVGDVCHRRRDDDWRIRYTEHGERREEYRKTEAEIRLLEGEVRARLSSDAPDPKRPVDDRILEAKGDTSADWLALLWWLAQRVGRGEVAAQRQLQVISGAARAAESHLNTEAIAREHAELKEMVRSIMSHRQNGTRIVGGAPAVAPAPQSQQPLH